jgi:hypothetical protein
MWYYSETKGVPIYLLIMLIAECHIFIVMLSAVMLNTVMLSAFMLSVVI